MFPFHKCKIEKIEEVKVYNTKNVQALYQKVFCASEKMDFTKGLTGKPSHITKHQDCFSMNLHNNHFSLYLIPVVIHGKTYQFIVDTGAQISGILGTHKALIDTFKVSHKMPIKSAGGSQKNMSMVCLDQFFMGALEIHNHHFVVFEEKQFKWKFINKDIMEFDGIIGWDILSQLDFELDCQKGIFSLINVPEYFTYCNLIAAHFPVVIVYDDKKQPAVFGIDSGAKESWINEAYAIQNQLKVSKESRGLGIGVHGLEKFAIKRIKECTLALFESKITLANSRNGTTEVFQGLHLDGIFGNEIFKKKKIQFLNSKGIVRILD